MGYRTVNLRPETYERLRTYKALGLSFDDVVNRVLDGVDVRAFHAGVLAEHLGDGSEPGPGAPVVESQRPSGPSVDRVDPSGVEAAPSPAMTARFVHFRKAAASGHRPE